MGKVENVLFMILWKYRPSMSKHYSIIFSYILLYNRFLMLCYFTNLLITRSSSAYLIFHTHLDGFSLDANLFKNIVVQKSNNSLEFR